VRSDLRGLDSPLRVEVSDGPLRGNTGAGDVDAAPGVSEIAMRLRKAVQSMPRENMADARCVDLAHVVDPDCERDGKTLLEGDGRKQRMLGAAGAAPLGKDRVEVGAVGVATVGELVKVLWQRPDTSGNRLA
jgi:hypothetical protein